MYAAAVEEAAEGGEGSYAVFWGAMAYGAWRFLRGLYFYLRPQALLDRVSKQAKS